MLDIFGFKRNLSRRSIVNYIYPIGSVYISANNTSPEVLFGGRWERLPGERYLMASDSSHAADTTGGSDTVNYTPVATIEDTSLSVDQLPAHTHTYNLLPAKTDGTAITVDQMPVHNHDVILGKAVQRSGTTEQGTGILTDTTAKPTVVSSEEIASCGGNQPHDHDIEYDTNEESMGNTGNNAGHNHTFTGIQGTININPFYISISMWKRIA